MQQIRGFQRFAVSAALALSAALAGCRGQPPEQAVRAQVDVLQQAIDARDASAVEDLLADDFVGNHGMDRRAAKQLAVGVFLRYRDVGARLGPVAVDLHGEDAATARFDAVATGGSGGLLPADGQVYRVETGWRRVGGEWKLVNASWRARL